MFIQTVYFEQIKFRSILPLALGHSNIEKGVDVRKLDFSLCSAKQALSTSHLIDFATNFTTFLYSIGFLIDFSTFMYFQILLLDL